MLRRVVERVTAQEQPDTAADPAARLRPLYPPIAAPERQLSGERAQFYGYRDGRYEPERPDGWWGARHGLPPRLPRDGRARVGYRDLCRPLLRGTEDDLVGRHFLDMILPEARTAAQAMFEVVSEEQEVRARRSWFADGSTVPIEFRRSAGTARSRSVPPARHLARTPCKSPIKGDEQGGLSTEVGDPHGQDLAPPVV